MARAIAVVLALMLCAYMAKARRNVDTDEDSEEMALKEIYQNNDEAEPPELEKDAFLPLIIRAAALAGKHAASRRRSNGRNRWWGKR